MKEPHWPNVTYPPIDYQAISLLLGAEVSRRRGSRSTRSTRELLETYEKLGIPLNEQKLLVRRGRRRDLRLGVASARRRRRSWRSTASSSARSARRCASIPSWCRSTSAPSCRTRDNFFAALNSAVFSDGSFVYIPKGVRCPMELSTYFRINAERHRPVRAHADHRRRGLVRELPRGLHGAEARRRTSCTRRSSSSSRSRTRRSSTRPCRTGTPATRTAWAASTTS